MPRGLLSLAAVLLPHAEVKVFDPEPLDQALEEVAQFQPHIIGITAMSQTYPRAKEVYSILKKKLPRAVFLLGGPHPTALPEEVYEELKPDAIIIGEGEETVLEVVQGKPWEEIQGIFYHGQKNPPRPLIEDLDSLPLPAYSLMPTFSRYLIPPGTIRGVWSSRGTINIMTSRGCPFHCIFCGSSLLFGKRVRRYSVARVLEEVEGLMKGYGVDSFWFTDDVFTVLPSWVEEFCSEIERRGLKLSWSCQLRADTVEKPLLLAMKRAGCLQVDIGVESGSEQVLKTLKKGIRPEDIERAFSLLKEVKLRAMATFVIGSPGETREDIRLTHQLLKKIKPSFSQFFFLIPYPGSELYEKDRSKNRPGFSSYQGLGVQDSPQLALQFTEQELLAIRRDYYRAVRYWNLRNYLSLRTIYNLLGIINPATLKAGLKALWKRKNLYDCMYAMLQEYRKGFKGETSFF